MKKLLLLVLVAGCSSTDELNASKIEVTKVFTDRLTKETYPRWALRNTDPACPAIGDLIAMLDNEGNTDPWGNPYVLTCTTGSKNPILIRSAGPDGNYESADDILSPRPHEH